MTPLCDGRDLIHGRRWRAEKRLSFRSSVRIGSEARHYCSTPASISTRCSGARPELVEVLITARQAHHSIVATQELMHTIGVLDPEDGRSSVDVIRTLVLSMPAHRTFVPDADVLGRVALLSGMLCRLQSYANDRKLHALHDCSPISAGSETRLHGADRQHRRL